MKKTLVISSALCLSSILFSQQKQIYIAPDCHTDYYWTAEGNRYAEAFCEMLDYYIALNDSTSDNPYPFQSKWNCDGSFWVYAYEQNRDSVQFERLIRQIREQKISVPLNTLNSVHGAAPTEAAIRDMYYAGALERKYDLDLDLAYSMEDHIMPLGMASIWAGGGAKYSWHGVCGCASKVEGLYSRPVEFYWYTGLDGRKVLMKWQSLSTDKKFNEGYSNQFPGGYAEAWKPEKSVEYYKSLMKNNEKYPFSIAAAFGKGWDALEVRTDEFITTALEHSDSSYQVIVSNEIDFFQEFEGKYGETLPSIALSYGGTEWGKGIASLASVSASVKRAIEKLRSAEAMYTLVALEDPMFAGNLEILKQKAWIACGLYYEHDWTADSPLVSKIQRANWQRNIASQLNSYVDTLYDLSLEHLENMVAGKACKDELFFAFNPLGWTRSDYCDYPYTGNKQIQILDLSNSESIPFQFITKNDQAYLRIRVNNIPAMGFKTFKIRKIRKPEEQLVPFSYHNSYLQSEKYKVFISPDGKILSLTDLQTGSNFIKGPSGLYPDSFAHAETPLEISVENQGPVSLTLLCKSHLPQEQETRVSLFNKIDRIEIESKIHGKFDAEARTFNFNFNLSKPDIWHEEVGAILNASLESEGGHYADSHSRYDWLTLNHFVSLSDTRQHIVVSNLDAYFMKTGHSTVQELDMHSPYLQILLGGQIDADLGLGFENQCGDSLLTNSFALKAGLGQSSHRESMAFALEHQNPLVSGKIKNNGKSYETLFSLFRISDPDVLIWAVKPAEEGIDKGIILRLWNLSDSKSKCTLSSDLEIKSCFRTMHTETDIEELSFVNGELNLELRHNGIETFRIYLE